MDGVIRARNASRAKRIASRLRSGRLDPRHVALAAALGYEPALACVEPADVGRDPWDWPADTLDDATWRLWACDCAERALLRERAAGREPGLRSWDAVRVARLYAVGEATGEQLDAARYATRSAGRSAARSATWAAARSTAWGARYAARSATWAAARSTAWGARYAARSATWGARSTAWGARYAAWGAAWGAERDWQRETLARRLCGEEVALAY